ncbi:MAG: hypothetical protein IJK38_10275 [Oscillospiraceae bacterium]|nr:hypothetical protein [Oscillospiraceae bacterium]
MEEDFLSDETKALAVEKLDAMQLYALCPEKVRDYSSLDFSDKGFTEIMYAIEDYDNRKAASLADTVIDQELSTWDRMPTLEDNAINNVLANSILSTVGIVDYCRYHDGMSLEEFYGTIGYVLAPEERITVW